MALNYAGPALQMTESMLTLRSCSIHVYATV
jgi:hypothetical protein